MISYREETWFKELEARKKAEQEKRRLLIVFLVLLSLFGIQSMLFGYRIWENFGMEQSQERNQNAGLVVARFEESYCAAVAAVRTAVVYINARTSSPSSLQSRSLIPQPSSLPSGDGISFDSAADGDPLNPGYMSSGVIFDPRGYILTNYHTIEGARDITVIPFGFSESHYQARLVRADIDSDLAVLKINSTDPLPAAVLGNSASVEVADTVFAIGSPFGLEHTVTMGIISDRKRDFDIDDRKYKDMMQTDAAINRGNSGGPLINIKGEVIGINTAIYSPTGVFNGIGFAIPIDKAKAMVNGV